MQHLSTTILFVALVIAINPGSGAAADDDNAVDQIAEEAKVRAVTILEAPKNVTQSSPATTTARPTSTAAPEVKPSFRPPIAVADIPFKPIKYVELPRGFYSIQKVPQRPFPSNTAIHGQPLPNPGQPLPNHGQPQQHQGQPQQHHGPPPQHQGQHQQHHGQPLQNHGQPLQNHGQPPPNHAQPLPNHVQPTHAQPNHPNKIYKYQQVVPMKHRGPYFAAKPQRQQLVFAASTGKPFIVTAKSPKFSIPVQTVNGIRAEFVRPPKNHPSSTTTTTTTTTTARPLRTKRIWPKHILEKMNGTATNVSKENSVSNNTKAADDQVPAASILRLRFTNKTLPTTSTEATTRGWRFTRVPKHKSTTTTQAPLNLTMQPNDWVPIVPSHFAGVKRIAHNAGKPGFFLNNRRSDFYQAPADERSDFFQSPTNRRSDVIEPRHFNNSYSQRRVLYLQSYGLIPLGKLRNSASNSRKRMAFFRKRRQLNGSRRPRGRYVVDDLHSEGSQHKPRVVTKIKHHHHHHHHKYVKTVPKPIKVPFKVEVPKPYPVTVEKRVPVPVAVPQIVQVEKKVPYPVTVEKKVPYPVHIKVPHPVPVKVIEKEYVPKPYPVIHHVPVLKHVEVKVPQPVPVSVEKKVPYPVQVKVPVEKRVPYPVEVEKKVPYPVPVKVFVPQPYPVEKQVPYPVEVKVKEPVEVIKHVPFKVPVPQPFAVKVPQPVRVEVEKKVPYPVEVEKRVPVPFRVYVPQRVEVEKKVPVYIPQPYPVERKVPVPVRVPVPVKVPYKVPVEVPVGVPIYLHSATGFDKDDDVVITGFTSVDNSITQSPQHTVTSHGNIFSGFSSRSDEGYSTTPMSPSSSS